MEFLTGLGGMGTGGGRREGRRLFAAGFMHGSVCSTWRSYDASATLLIICLKEKDEDCLFFKTIKA